MNEKIRRNQLTTEDCCNITFWLQKITIQSTKLQMIPQAGHGHSLSNSKDDLERTELDKLISDFKETGSFY